MLAQFLIKQSIKSQHFSPTIELKSTLLKFNNENASENTLIGIGNACESFFFTQPFTLFVTARNLCVVSTSLHHKADIKSALHTIVSRSNIKSTLKNQTYPSIDYISSRDISMETKRNELKMHFDFMDLHASLHSTRSPHSHLECMQIWLRTYNFCIYTIVKPPADIQCTEERAFVQKLIFMQMQSNMSEWNVRLFFPIHFMRLRRARQL